MLKRLLAGSALCALTFGVMAQAAPIVTLHGSNSGITDFSFSYNNATSAITLNETWGASGPGVLEISGLDIFRNYYVVKNVTNNTGVDWISLSNELLDPYNRLEDILDTTPLPGHVPAGFSTSNNLDGLNFAQDANPGIPRTSIAFGSVVADEFTHERDLLSFFGGVVSGSGGTDTMTFGLTNTFGTQSPFLLFQRTTEGASAPAVPEPGTISLLGFSLLAVGVIRKRLQQS
jgi:hypothetical protein